MTASDYLIKTGGDIVIPCSAILIAMHEQGFGVLIRFCDLSINFDKNFIEQSISLMITKNIIYWGHIYALVKRYSESDLKNVLWMLIIIFITAFQTILWVVLTEIFLFFSNLNFNSPSSWLPTS